MSQRFIAEHTEEERKRFAYLERRGWGPGWDIRTYEGERMISRFGGYHSFRSHLSFLPARRIGVVSVANRGLASALSSALAAFTYDLDAGGGVARERIEARPQELQSSITRSVQSAGKEEAARRSRVATPSRRALQFRGAYGHPSFGLMILGGNEERLTYRWGVLYGEVDASDAEKARLRINFAGDDEVRSIRGSDEGAAASLSFQGIDFKHVR